MAQSSRDVRVGTKELVAMLTLFVSAEVFLSYPSLTLQLGLEAGWIISVLSGLIALVIFLIVNAALQKSYPGHDLIDVARITMGQTVGFLVSFIIGVYFLLVTAAVMREFMEQVISTVLQNTPILIIGGMFTVVVCYIAQCGLEGICRTASFILPVLLVGMAFLCLATLNWWTPAWLLPLWGAGAWPILKGSLLYSSIFTNVLLVCLIYPHAHEPEKLMRVGVWSVVLTDLILTGFILTFNMVFPAMEGENIAFPFYELARLIYVGRFVQRLESIFIFLWVAVAVIRISMTLWASAYSFGRGFKWPSYRPGVPTLGLAAFSLSMFPRSQIQVTSLTQTYLMAWGNLIVFGLPLLIVLVGLLTHKARGKQSGGGGRRRRKRTESKRKSREQHSTA